MNLVWQWLAIVEFSCTHYIHYQNIYKSEDELLLSEFKNYIFELYIYNFMKYDKWKVSFPHGTKMYEHLHFFIIYD